ANAGSIYLREGDKLIFSFTQNEALQAKLPRGKKMIYSTFTLPISHETISGYVASTGETLNIPDVYDIPEDKPYSFGRQFDEASGYRSRSMLTFPIMASNSFRSSDCGPSQSAAEGSLWTSTIRPSAPAAMAA
ncbi:MAG TPA: GAF domain-containing protein, partial [Nitrospirae bacterium]|nr:GAF domain-containing protein [Nitrospirota bacterium]